MVGRPSARDGFLVAVHRAAKKFMGDFDEEKEEEEEEEEEKEEEEEQN